MREKRAREREREPQDWGIYICTICMHKVSEYVYHMVCIVHTHPHVGIFQTFSCRLLIPDATQAANGKLHKESFSMGVPQIITCTHSCNISVSIRSGSRFITCQIALSVPKVPHTSLQQITTEIIYLAELMIANMYNTNVDIYVIA